MPIYKYVQGSVIKYKEVIVMIMNVTGIKEKITAAPLPEQTGEKKEPAKNTGEERSGVVVEISENLREMYQQQLEDAKESADAMGEEMQNMAKILEIARRISRGDHVPASDEKKLMEFDKDLYQMAKASAALYANRKHKKYKSLFDEEDDSQEEKIRELRREKDAAPSSAGTGKAVETASETATEAEVSE